MQTINVQLDLSTPTGRRLLRQMEKHPKAAKVQYPLPEAINGITFPHEDVWEEVETKFNEHYGTNYKFK